MTNDLWDWFNGVVGRGWELRVWDCFCLLVDGQRAAGLSPHWCPAYHDGEAGARGAQRAFVREIAAGLRHYRRIDQAAPGAAALFRVGKVPIHVGLVMRPGLMAHVNIETATTLAEYGPGTDYHAAFEGYYVPA